MITYLPKNAGLPNDTSWYITVQTKDSKSSIAREWSIGIALPCLSINQEMMPFQAVVVNGMYML